MEPINNNQTDGVQQNINGPEPINIGGNDLFSPPVEVSERLPWWRRIINFFMDNRLEESEALDVLRNAGNPITSFLDRYIFRRHCPYCFGYVSKRIYRERSHAGAQSVVSKVPYHLPSIKIYECPSCHHTLPADFFDSLSSSIAVVGGKEAGKSSFITIFCEFLIYRNSILNELGIFGSILNPEGTDQFESNRSMLISQNLPLDGTKSLQQPIVVRLQSKHHRRSLYITLKDSPGEHYEELDTLIREHPNLQYADGIIFLMNPLDINGVLALIEQEKPGTIPFQRNSTPNFELVENLFKLYLTTRRVRPNRKISVPTVFCLSRADLLEDITHLYIPQDAETSFTEVEDIVEEMNLVASDLRELLEETDLRLLNLLDKSFKNYKLFPVSPLGKSPTYQASRYIIEGAVEPKGVLQPFIWILNQTNFIKKI